MGLWEGGWGAGWGQDGGQDEGKTGAGWRRRLCQERGWAKQDPGTAVVPFVTRVPPCRSQARHMPRGAAGLPGTLPGAL